MLIRDYEIGGFTFQFREGHEPPGAVPVEKKERPAPANKGRRAPANKARKVQADKEATSEGSRTRRKSRPAVTAEP